MFKLFLPCDEVYQGKMVFLDFCEAKGIINLLISLGEGLYFGIFAVTRVYFNYRSQPEVFLSRK